MVQIHKNLASGKWQKMSLSAQLANIGSEFNRTMHWERKNDEESKKKSFARVLELVDLTIQDNRWKSRLSELVRLREVLCDVFTKKNIYNISREKLNNYFLYFGLAARR